MTQNMTCDKELLINQAFLIFVCGFESHCRHKTGIWHKYGKSPFLAYLSHIFEFPWHNSFTRVYIYRILEQNITQNDTKKPETHVWHTTARYHLFFLNHAHRQISLFLPICVQIEPAALDF